MFSIDGLVSGLDTSSIIEGLLSIQKNQIARLESQKQEIEIRQTAFEGIEANAIALRGAAERLNSVSNDVFSVFSASSSDEEAIQVAAGKNAATGTFQLQIAQLAKAAQSSTQAYSSSEALVTQGELSLQIGDRTATVIQINEENNTLTGVAEAINSASDDVAATIVNDGTGSRILLTSQHTGAENQITISNSTADSNATETKLDLSGPLVQEAADAIIQLGSGAGAIQINRTSNTVDDVIQGLTLNLKKAEVGKEISISVARDSGPAKEAIEGFVSAFNTVMSYVDEQTKYDADADQAGLLLGDSATNSIRNQLRNTLARSVANIESNANRLSQIGVVFDDKGSLQINSATLSNALAGEQEGIDMSDIRKMFSIDAVTTNAGIQFASGSQKTNSSINPWQVTVTQSAARASIESTKDVAERFTIDASNDSFEIEIDGVESGTLALKQGTYSQTELADHVQTVINQASSLGAREVSISVEDNRFKVESLVYGTRSEVGSVSGDFAAALGFDGSEYSRGRDVAGYFTVDGVTETATGNGRILAGDEDNENTAGLHLRVSLTASQIGAGVESDVTVSRGFAAEMDRIIGQLLDPEKGRFKNSVDSYEDQIASIENSVERFNSIFKAKQEQLVSQFVAIETSINSLQTTSSFLAAQLGGISSLARK